MLFFLGRKMQEYIYSKTGFGVKARPVDQL